MDVAGGMARVIALFPSLSNNALAQLVVFSRDLATDPRHAHSWNDHKRGQCHALGGEMRQHQHLLEDTEDQEAADRQTASLAGVAVTLLLLVVGLFLVHALHNEATIEDCLMSGRSNCDVVISNLP